MAAGPRAPASWEKLAEAPLSLAEPRGKAGAGRAAAPQQVASKPWAAPLPGFSTSNRHRCLAICLGTTRSPPGLPGSPLLPPSWASPAPVLWSGRASSASDVQRTSPRDASTPGRWDPAVASWLSRTPCLKWQRLGRHSALHPGPQDAPRPAGTRQAGPVPGLPSDVLTCGWVWRDGQELPADRTGSGTARSPHALML